MSQLNDQQPKGGLMPRGSDDASNDPFIYANLLTGLVGKDGIWSVLTGDVTRMFHLMTDTRRLAKERIEQLQKQTDTVEYLVANAQPRDAGQNLNKLR